MTQAIVTRYHGPTNSRGSRIKATCWGGSITVPYSHSANSETNHARAAQALCEKMGWHRTGWVGGATPDERGWAFVATDARVKF